MTDGDNLQNQSNSNSLGLENTSNEQNEELTPASPGSDKAKTVKPAKQVEVEKPQISSTHLFHPSFFIALVTITLTILAGIFIARFIKSFFFEKPSTEEYMQNQVRETKPKKAISTPTISNNPTSEKEETVDSFDLLLTPTESSETTKSSQKIATQEGLLIDK